MKPLFVIVFALLTAVAAAELLTPYSLAQVPLPAERSGGSSEGLAGLAKILDKPPPVNSTVFRGQTRVAGDEPTGIMSSPPPPARGPIEDPIEPRLVGDSSEMSDSVLDIIEAKITQNPGKLTPSGTSALSDPLGYGAWVAATCVLAMGLVWMVSVAYDYHQRWIQAMTMQNERYLGGSAFDGDLDDPLGSHTFSDGFGLRNA